MEVVYKCFQCRPAGRLARVVKRESGENPERSGHCKKGVSPKSAIGRKLSAFADSVRLRRLDVGGDLQVRKRAEA